MASKSIFDTMADIRREGTDAPETTGISPEATDGMTSSVLDTMKQIRDARGRARLQTDEEDRPVDNWEHIPLIDEIQYVKESAPRRTGIDVAGQTKEGFKDVGRHIGTFTSVAAEVVAMRNMSDEYLATERETPFSTFGPGVLPRDEFLRTLPKDPAERKAILSDPEKFAQARVDYIVKNNTEYAAQAKKVRAYIQTQLKADPEYLQSTGWVEDFIRMGPQIATQVVAGLVTGGAGSAALMFAEIAGATTEKLMADGIEAEEALQWGMVNAAAQAPMEAIGLSKLTGLLKFKGTVLQKLKQVGEQMGTEWITEFMQSYPEAATELMAKNPTKDGLEKWNKFLDKVMTWEHTAGAAKEATIASLWGGISGAAGSAVTGERSESTEDPKKAASEITHQAANVETVEQGMHVVMPENIDETAEFLDEMHDEPTTAREAASKDGKPTVENLLGIEDADSHKSDQSVDIEKESDGIALGSNLITTPQQAETQLKETDAVASILEDMAITKGLDQKREVILNNQVGLQNTEDDFTLAVIQGDHEKALMLANRYATMAQQTAQNVDEFLMGRQQKLAKDEAALDPQEIRDLGSYSQGLIQRAEELVTSQQNAIQAKQAQSNMLTEQAKNEDPAVFRAALLKAEDEASGRNPEAAKIYRGIDDLQEIKDTYKPEYYYEKGLDNKKLIKMKGDLRRKIRAEKSDPKVDDDTKSTDEASLRWVEQQIIEKNDYDTAKDLEKVAEEKQKLNQERAKALTQSDERVKKERAAVAAKTVQKAEVKTQEVARAKEKQAVAKKATELDKRREAVQKQKARVRKAPTPAVSEERLAELEASKARKAAVKKQVAEVAKAERKPHSLPKKVKIADLKKKEAEYVILTPDNPQSTEVSATQNRQARLALIKELKDRGIDYEIVDAVFEGATEKSFIIKGMTKKEGKELSDRLDQSSYIHARGEDIALIEGDKANVVKKVDAKVRPDADVYSVIEGKRWAIPFYTEKSSDLDTDMLSPQVSTAHKQTAKNLYRAAAMRFRGKVYEGPSHMSIVMENKAIEDFVNNATIVELNNQIEQGFVSHDGKFSDRFQASREVGLSKDQYLISEDFMAQVADGAPGRKAPAAEKKAYVLKALTTESDLNQVTRKLIEKSGVKVELLTGTEINELKMTQGAKDLIRVANGVYSSGKNRIIMNVENLSGLSQRQIQSSLAHEALHSAIFKGLREINPDKFRKSMRTLSNWWNDTSLNVDPIRLSNSDRRVQGFWGVMNDAVQSIDAATTAMENGQPFAKQNLDRAMAKMEEALTYPFTSPTVAKFLNGVKLDQAYMSKGVRSMWDWFVDHMLKLLDLKVKTGSSLESLVSIANSTLELKSEPAMPARFSKEDGSFDFGANVTKPMVDSWTKDLDDSAPGAVKTQVVATLKDAEALTGYALDDNVASLWVPEHELDVPHGAKKGTKKEVVPEQVIIIAENITSQEHLLSKWMHEQVGHHGLRGVFANNALFNRFLDQSFGMFKLQDRKILDEIIELYDIGRVDENGRRMLTVTQKRLAAEEVIARKSESLKPVVKKGLVNKFKLFLNRWLPKSWLGKKLTFQMKEADVLNMLSMAREQVMTGNTVFGDMMSKALDARRPRVEFKPWKTLPNFMFTDRQYMNWIKEVHAESPQIRKWYTKHQETLQKMFGKDADLFNILLSVTSPQADVNTNVIFAAQTYAYMMGLTDKPGALFANKLKKRIDGSWTSPKNMFKDLESNLFKVTEFVRGLMGDPDATVGDLWMFRAFFGDGAVYNKENESYSVPQVVAMRQKIHDLAAKMSKETGDTWTAREVQAAIWVHINAKQNGIAFSQVADYQSGFNKPSARFDGKSPLEWLNSLIPNMSDGPLSDKIGITEVPMAPISPLAKKRLDQIRKELKEQGKKVDKFTVDERGMIKISAKNSDEIILNTIDAIAKGGRRMVVPTAGADFFREVFGFEHVNDIGKDKAEIQLSEAAIGAFTNAKGILTATQIRDNLSGFSGTYTQVARFSREARKNLDQIKSMSQEDINNRDRELMKTGNLGVSVLGKIHEWRDQAGRNIDRLANSLEQDFLDRFGGRKVLVGVVGSGRLLNTAKTELLNKAMHLYIDSGTGANATRVIQYVQKLSRKGLANLTQREKQHLEIIDRMGKMTEEEIAWANDNIRSQYENFFEFSKENQLIESHIDNYVKRQWKMPKELKESDIVWNSSSPTGFKLVPSSGKPRSFDSIIDGWDAGMDLKGQGAIQNMQDYATEIGVVYANRRFTEYMRGLINFTSGALMHEQNVKTDPNWKPPVGYLQIKTPGFAKPFHKLYAVKDIATEINKIGRVSSAQFWETPVVRGIRRINAMLKSTILSVSLFHHFAGLRSYMFGVSGKKGKQWNPIRAYREGLKKLEQQTGLVDPQYAHLGPIADMLVKEGLTVGRTQDWDEQAIQASYLEEMLLSTKGETAGRVLKGWQAMRRAKRSLTTGLFGRLFAGLKVEAGAIELVHKIEQAQKKKGSALTDAEIKLIAGQVATLINADFGGLHLQRMGRNPDLQRAAQMLMLAPDWTESNWRTVSGMIPGANNLIGKALGDTKETEGMAEVYRKFWGGIAARGVLSVALMQAFMYAMSDEEDRKEYLDFMIDNVTSVEKFSKGRWISLDATGAENRVREAFGLKRAEKRRVVSVLGHFKDILKLGDPYKLIEHKMSPIAGTGFSALTQEDWKGSRFTTIREAFEDGIVPKLTADNKFAEDIGGLTVWSTMPSFLGYRLRQSVPIFLSEALMAASGETSVLSALARAGGLDVRDVGHKPAAVRRYEEVRSEINALDRQLETAKESKDRGLIREARQDIKDYKNFAVTKSRMKYARTQLSQVNKSIKGLETKRDEGKKFTKFDERRLDVLLKRREKIYEKFKKVVDR